MSSSLALHSNKFDSKLVARKDLLNLPEPQALGSRHKPVPHAVLVDAITAEIDIRGFMVKREQLALGQKGEAIFGVMDLVPALSGGTESLIAKAHTPDASRGLSFGFRSSTNQALSIQAVAGTRVFVCDNLALSGNMIAIQRKSTTRLDLGDALALGFDKFLAHQEEITVRVEEMSYLRLSDQAAKATIFDVFYGEALPTRLFDDVSRFYFEVDELQRPDCSPRTLWGLYNACTRAAKDLPPASLFRSSVRLGKAFTLTQSADIVEGEVL